eukprot:m.235838 g.235838  ORF g.235838 m.235838 type:complete len:67 (-) comp33670_c4_seq2:1554-1754(-)
MCSTPSFSGFGSTEFCAECESKKVAQQRKKRRRTREPKQAKRERAKETDKKTTARKETQAANSNCS